MTQTRYMNGARHGKLNLMKKKSHVLEMGKSGIRPSWTYKLGENIILIAKENDLGVVIQNNYTREIYR